MKTLPLLSLCVGLVSLPVLAEETTGEKVEAKTNDAKRSVTKGAHKTEEALCTGTKAECAKQKVEHRASEAKDTVGDKASEAKHKVD